MRNAGSTTVIEITSLLLLASTLGTITGQFTGSALVVSSGYLAVTLWRRNGLYRWLEGHKKNEALLSSDLWRDMVRRIEFDRDHAHQRYEILNNQLTDLHHALSSLNVGLVIVNDNWSLAWWNSRSGELLGLQHPEDVNGYLFALLRSPLLKNYALAEGFQEPLVIDNFNNTQRSIEFFFGPVALSGFIILVRDLTQLQKLNKMKSDFIANVSHELKTPLTVINGYLETILDNQMTTGVAEKAIKNSLSQAERMGSIIQDLITLSQLETSQAPESTQFNLNHLIDQVIQQAQLLRKHLNKHLTRIEITIPDKWSMTGSSKEIYSLLSNLLSNAVRYCPDHSLIKLWIETRQNEVAISVQDNGPGIGESHIHRLTERFYRVDQSHSSSTGGTGLGLSIAKHIVSRHGGDFQIQSEVGVGTIAICKFSNQRCVRSVT